VNGYLFLLTGNILADKMDNSVVCHVVDKRLEFKFIRALCNVVFDTILLMNISCRIVKNQEIQYI
jgi:hypothetical protein